MPTEIKNQAEFNAEINKNQPKLVVVDFHAKWCGPCRKISPFYDEMSAKYPEVSFLKVEDIVQVVITRNILTIFYTFIPVHSSYLYTSRTWLWLSVFVDFLRFTSTLTDLKSTK